MCAYEKEGEVHVHVHLDCTFMCRWLEQYCDDVVKKRELPQTSCSLVCSSVNDIHVIFVDDTVLCSF